MASSKKNSFQQLSLVLSVLAFAVAGAALLRPSFAASTPKNATCSVSSTGVGKPLVISGTGYTPNTAYPLTIQQGTGGSAGTSTWTDGSGNFNFSSLYALYPGTYTVTVYSAFHQNSKIAATCSMAI